MSAVLRVLHNETGVNLYAVFKNPKSASQVANLTTQAFEAYLNGSREDHYGLALQSDGGDFAYSAVVPTWLVAALPRVDVEIFKRAGSKPANSDPPVAGGQFEPFSATFVRTS